MIFYEFRDDQLFQLPCYNMVDLTAEIEVEIDLNCVALK